MSKDRNIDDAELENVSGAQGISNLSDNSGSGGDTGVGGSGIGKTDDPPGGGGGANPPTTNDGPNTIGGDDSDGPVSTIG